MRLTLKDYQIDAVRGVLDNLRRGRSFYRMEGELSSFSLSATTGAGKTVMAAAVIESLFFGNDDFGFDGDPGAVVVWFSDSPDLNRQSLHRVQSAASELDSRLVEVQTSFNAPKFEPQTVYFLNRQKLARGSNLVKGHTPDGAQGGLWKPRPDEQQTSIFDTFRNTLEDPNLTLYLMVDEAHKGLGNKKADEEDRGTILRRLIGGDDAGLPIPVVWGISATVERFTKAMAGIEGRTDRHPIRVDSALVQASGLLKDDIVLDIPAESGPVDSVLLKRATRKLLESTESWAAYSKQQGIEPVVPLMVVQVPNNSTEETLRQAIETILSEWEDMPINAVAHVFGEHKDLTAGQWPVPYISPERVQDTKRVQVLFAKEAVSTGWDCPRAEVLMSFRPAQDQTYITQMLGRMVRTPLAGRVPGNDVLNSVLCVLPKFDRKTATRVAETLMRGAVGTADPTDDSENETDTGGGVGRRVLFDPKPMTPVEDDMEAVWAKFLSVPSETLPKKTVKPVKRLTALAQALSDDGLLADAGADAHNRMHKLLSSRAVQYADKVEAAVMNVKTVEGQSLLARMGGLRVSASTFTEDADQRVIREAFKSAGRVFSADVTRTYAEHLAGGNDEDALWDAYVRIAALSLVPDVAEDLDREANKIAAEWFNTYRIDIKRLPDSRKQVYNDLLAMATEPQRLDLVKPTLWQEDTKVSDAAGVETALPTRTDHLLVGNDGTFPVNFNSWETDVVDQEMARPGAKGWFRNPSRSNESSLAISYRDKDTWKMLRPDFMFFTEGHGEVQVSIVDPHGHHLRDALPKLRGLAHYAAKYEADVFRVEAISKIGDKLRVLDLTLETVRNAVMAETGDAEALYAGPLATDY